MKLPAKYTIDVEENESIRDASKRAREWSGSVVGAMVWLSTILPNASYVFRGHANAAWDLQSSLYRATAPATLEDLVREEADLLQRISTDFWFRREFDFTPAATPGSADSDRTMAVLQHHGVPTRLLDVTADPLVGLYFAVVGQSAANDMDDVDGAVVLIRNVTAGGGLSVHVIPAPQVSERVSAQRACFVAPTLGAEPGNATAKTVPFDFFNVDVANGSLTDFDNLIDNYLRGQFTGRPPAKAPNLLVFHVPKGLKQASRDVLRSLGVSARTLFPGSDGFRRDFSGF